MRRHFVRAGDGFYYRQNQEQLAFEIRGETFRARDSSLSVATAMVELAESRGYPTRRNNGGPVPLARVWKLMGLVSRRNLPSFGSQNIF